MNVVSVFDAFDNFFGLLLVQLNILAKNSAFGVDVHLNFVAGVYDSIAS